MDHETITTTDFINDYLLPNKILLTKYKVHTNAINTEALTAQLIDTHVGC